MCLQINTLFSVTAFMNGALNGNQYGWHGRDAEVETHNRYCGRPNLETEKRRSRGCVALCSKKATVMR